MGIDEISLDSFFQFLKRAYPEYVNGCSLQLFALIRNKSRIVNLKAGTPLLEIGDREHMSRVLLRGLGVGVDEYGAVREVLRPGDFLMDFSSFITQEPSIRGLRAYTSIRILEVPRDVESELISLHSGLQGFVNARITHIRMVEASWREILESSHSERYRDFLNRYPGISQVMRVKDLATLLGYKYDTLKRIRQAELERDRAGNGNLGKRRVSYSTGCYF